MMKRFFSMMAILAVSLLAACAQVPPQCKSCPMGIECCGACPCGAAMASEQSVSGKICDPSKMKKPYGKRIHHKAKAAAAVPATAPAVAKTSPVKAKDAKVVAPVAPAPEKAKAPSMFDSVKNIMKDVKPKDEKKPQ